MIQTEQEALDVLEALFTWAAERPELLADEGPTTGAIAQRGRIVVSRDREGTYGVSSYESQLAAMRHAVNMEKGMRAWLRSIGREPRAAENPRALEERLRIPADFGGLVGVWVDPTHAVVLRVGHGLIVEMLALTPLNAVQLVRHAKEIVAAGKREGYITDEHERQAHQLPPMPMAEYDADYANRVTGDE